MASKLNPYSLLSKEKEKMSEGNTNEAAKVAAATMIQRLWRGKHNTTKDEYMSPSIRWEDAATQAKLQVDRRAAHDGKNSPLQRWRRAAFMIGRIRDQNKVLENTGMKVDDVEVKQLEVQHWLELIDEKHRYGSNLKYYHQRWRENDTTQNFFSWLDHGDGKHLSLSECPRDRLEKERIIYLSTEQRLNYLVKISDDGKLLWAKNNQPIDTTAGHWKDVGDGGGIVPIDIPDRVMRFRRPKKLRPGMMSSTSLSSSNSSIQEYEATHYANVDVKGKSRLTRAVKKWFTTKGVIDRLLRKTVQRNTWIYVSDKHFNIFIGIKETGAFQHSSFTAGGIVTSAGLITVKQGMIHTLSPLSGHYRTSVDHFHQFIKILEERGVDISKVKISKAEAALWGIEHINKFKKKQGKITKTGKKKMENTIKSSG